MSSGIYIPPNLTSSLKETTASYNGVSNESTQNVYLPVASIQHRRIPEQPQHDSLATISSGFPWLPTHVQHTQNYPTGQEANDALSQAYVQVPTWLKPNSPSVNDANYGHLINTNENISNRDQPVHSGFVDEQSVYTSYAKSSNQPTCNSSGMDHSQFSAILAYDTSGLPSSSLTEDCKQIQLCDSNGKTEVGESYRRSPFMFKTQPRDIYDMFNRNQQRPQALDESYLQTNMNENLLNNCTTAESQTSLTQAARNSANYEVSLFGAASKPHKQTAKPTTATRDNKSTHLRNQIHKVDKTLSPTSTNTNNHHHNNNNNALSRSSYMCRKCRAHGKLLPVKQHKRNCPFRNCTCSVCSLVNYGRHIVAKQIALYRDQKNHQPHHQLANSSTSTSFISQTSDDHHQQTLTNTCRSLVDALRESNSIYKSYNMKPTSSQVSDEDEGPHCRRCRNHGKHTPWKGHKKACPHRYCICQQCILISLRKSNEKNLRDVVQEVGEIRPTKRDRDQVKSMGFKEIKSMLDCAGSKDNVTGIVKPDSASIPTLPFNPNSYLQPLNTTMSLPSLSHLKQPSSFLSYSYLTKMTDNYNNAKNALASPCNQYDSTDPRFFYPLFPKYPFKTPNFTSSHVNDLRNQMNFTSTGDFGLQYDPYAAIASYPNTTTEYLPPNIETDTPNHILTTRLGQYYMKRNSNPEQAKGLGDEQFEQQAENHSSDAAMYMIGVGDYTSMQKFCDKPTSNLHHSNHVHFTDQTFDNSSSSTEIPPMTTMDFFTADSNLMMNSMKSPTVSAALNFELSSVNHADIIRNLVQTASTPQHFASLPDTRSSFGAGTIRTDVDVYSSSKKVVDQHISFTDAQGDPMLQLSGENTWAALNSETSNSGVGSMTNTTSSYLFNTDYQTQAAALAAAAAFAFQQQQQQRQPQQTAKELDSETDLHHTNILREDYQTNDNFLGSEQHEVKDTKQMMNVKIGIRPTEKLRNMTMQSLQQHTDKEIRCNVEMNGLYTINDCSPADMIQTRGRQNFPQDFGDATDKANPQMLQNRVTSWYADTMAKTEPTCHGIPKSTLQNFVNSCQATSHGHGVKTSPNSGYRDGQITKIPHNLCSEEHNGINSSSEEDKINVDDNEELNGGKLRIPDSVTSCDNETEAAYKLLWCSSLEFPHTEPSEAAAAILTSTPWANTLTK